MSVITKICKVLVTSFSFHCDLTTRGHPTHKFPTIFNLDPQIRLFFLLFFLFFHADEESLQLDIICFNFENVRVMWNLTDPMGTNLTVLYR